MLSLPIYEYLFQRIREKLPIEASLSDVVAELLHVSHDSAYRRIRGETPLVLEEAKTLCDAFNLSLDSLFKTKEHSVLFSYVRLNNSDYGFDYYLQGILNSIETISSIEGAEIMYLTKDIAFFHYFGNRTLFAFRYFFWMKSIMQHPDFASRKFSLDYLTSALEKKGNRILQLYNKIPSSEIWNTECINSIITQIEYYRDAGYFNSESDSEMIYEALGELIMHLKIQAEYGCKFMPGENPSVKKNNFEFYYNRMVLGDNTIIAGADGKKTLYLNYDVLDYLVTQDEVFCNDVYQKLSVLMKKATLISNASEKQRNIFFNLLLRKIPKHKNMVKL
jgi:hypothetical protein